MRLHGRLAPPGPVQERHQHDWELHVDRVSSGPGRPADDPGGDLYPTLIRKNPIKPIKIFLQDGSADLDNQHGNWFLANQQMLAALNYANTVADAKKLPGARYEVKHEWGDGAHSDAHGGSLLPEILRWMW